VRERYGRIAGAGGCGCAPDCCAPDEADGGSRGVDAAAEHAWKIGYDLAETVAVPEGANLGLGCGNPNAIAALDAGQTVLDLGSGPGFDAFLAARAVGSEGKVIGVDMTPEMVSRARANAERGGFAQVEFRLGEIEHLPVADASIDVVLSNCVINLSPDKFRVFAEAWRVLKPGGRLAISDVVALAPVPQAVRDDAQLYASCASGAAGIDEVESLLRGAGFVSVRVQPAAGSAAVVEACFPGRGIGALFASATIEATKPQSS
jgi:SAM-dependent methyltransferase